MSIDKKIQQELLNEARELDALLANDEDLFQRFFSVFRGNMRYWMALITIITLAATAGLLFSGYRFYVAVNTADQLFWGVSLIILCLVQGMFKMWTFMAMNRQSTLKEIKRVELAVERLERLLETQS